MTARHTFILILLLLVAATGLFLQEPGSVNTVDTAAERGPDMFAEKIEVTVMNNTGQPAYRIMADQLRHSPDSERFDLTRPTIEVKRVNGEHWNIAAESGQMTDKGDLLWLLGKVSINRQGGNSMRINTSDLLVKPNEELAETESAVSITATGYKIDAVGLKADFRNRLLEFRSRVRGTINVAG